MNISPKKKIILITLAFFLFIFLSNGLFGLFLESENRNQTPEISKKTNLSTAPNLPQKATSKKRRPLIAQDPAKYGIIVQSAADQPRNQEQWNIFMDKVLVKSKLLEQENAKPALEMIKKTPEEFQTRMKEIDNRIAIFEQKKMENPSDEDAQQRLQTFYALRAMTQAMESKITAPKNEPSTPANILPEPASESNLNSIVK
ncbi:MAG TPA: hypothetical protein PL155_08025 [Candidatus Omnitrophota bacterium]|nr:hypothetical protein [Candidatus Omnitrophota bacterium]HPD85222.1 hypothetical protein [Candidatus Omnitrophota bacterium]HRZ04277.1 hypothetical protein [Candidatus Omnitrophota bacterium]